MYDENAGFRNECKLIDSLDKNGLKKYIKALEISRQDPWSVDDKAGDIAEDLLLMRAKDKLEMKGE